MDDSVGVFIAALFHAEPPVQPNGLVYNIAVDWGNGPAGRF